MHKILVLKNDKLKTNSSFIKAKEYFASKGIEVTFYEKSVIELVSVSEYLKRPGFDNNTGKPAIISYMGLDSIVINNLKKYIKDNEYDCVIFSWDISTLQQSFMGNEVVTSFVKDPLFPNTQFIQLAINQYFIEQDNLWDKITHETMHALCRKYKAVDEMDMTMDGKAFFKNDDPYAVDGNYARTLNNLKPLMSKTKKYKYFSETEAKDMTAEFMLFADELRHRLGWSLSDSSPRSSFRTPAENKLAGGVPDSAHLKGKAKDWRIIEGAKKYQFVAEAQKLAKETGKIIGVGIGDNFCHLDVGHRAANGIWNYK